MGLDLLIMASFTCLLSTKEGSLREGSHQSRITQTLNLQLLHIPREKRKMKMTTSLTPHPEFGSIWDQAQPLEVTLTADIVATVLLEEPSLNA